MDNSVMIKGNKNGITVVLDSNLDFAVLKEKLAEKFQSSAKVFGSSRIAVSFQGRTLTDSEELELIDIIGQNSELEVICVLNDDESKGKMVGKAIDESLMDVSGNFAVFKKGIIRGGDTINEDKSIILLGDVNPNASVSSNGNIVILGSLRGMAQAGASGNKNAFIFALDMQPMQLRIADVIARAADEKETEKNTVPMIAYLDDDNICIETVSKKAVNSIKLTPSF